MLNSAFSLLAPSLLMPLPRLFTVLTNATATLEIYEETCMSWHDLTMTKLDSIGIWHVKQFLVGILEINTKLKKLDKVPIKTSELQVILEITCELLTRL